ncbi:MAG TPA: isoprenylcysteine carboxylmethyltransferase family protein [Sandaracinaceae bacterium LLY-WYZ-13_1]|nr:isoprenylcysteine carboxylmethyltransferase family protein [Sandaracinaceae bacterium LLY-WYZ-13_1]
MNALPTTEAAFLLLVALVAAQRLWEVRKSRAHEQALRAAGAVEHAPGQMRWMKLLHGAWLVACVAEAFLLDRAIWPAVSWIAIGVFLAGQLLRLSAMRALGPRWTVRILVLPGRPPVTRGIFRWVRHPNYLGVVLEVAALPLIGGAWITAIVFSLLNGLMLWRRIVAEERALEHANEYGAHLGDRPRLVPGGSP